jgi:citrate synthase
VTERAELKVNGATIDLPVVVGTENEKAIDVGQLRSKTGYVTLDPAFVNTASTLSSITYIDGEKGILRYRGIPIEQLGEHSTFVETAYLLIYGHLPERQELTRFSTLLTRHSLIHEDMKRFFDGYPSTAHPMAILSSMVCSLSSFYPEALDVKNTDQLDITIARVLSKVRTIAAFSYKKSIGQPFVYPQNSLSYCANFLNMMFSVPAEPYIIDEEAVRTLNLLLILHADHEQNCSTSTVRLVGSAQANLFASIAAGICALWGPLHGGANQEVVDMLRRIHDEGGDVKKFVAMAKDNKSQFRLMGFGHRVYKSYDPRAKIVKRLADEVFQVVGIDKDLEIALELERIALQDDYFVTRKLYPNVDFYSGLIYQAMGFPVDMFPVLFAIPRTAGWIAQWEEMLLDPDQKIARPRQIYVGPGKRDYVPREKRK